jgi:acetyl-CoA carboxylase biotin carboxyl carrier protein
MTDVKAQDIEAFVRTFDELDWQNLHVVIDGLEIYLSKNPGDAGRVQTGAARSADGAAPAAAPAALVAPADAPSEARAATPATGVKTVRATTLGTFYRAPKPGAPPYVSIGDKVEADTEICLLEVMKLFTAVRAGIAGTIREILVKDSEVVEFEQPLFLIEPSA